jgi:hypothetical protein
LRFEVRSGSAELDFVDTTAQIQPLALWGWRPQQPLQPPPKIGGFADVRIPIPVQRKHRRCCGYILKEDLAGIRPEF